MGPGTKAGAKQINARRIGSGVRLCLQGTKRMFWRMAGSCTNNRVKCCYKTAPKQPQVKILL